MQVVGIITDECIEKPKNHASIERTSPLAK